MGRRRIDIEYIEDNRVRQVCLCKRRNGVYKKAADLSKLTGVDIAIVVIDGEKANEYGSTDVNMILEKYKRIRSGGSDPAGNAQWAAMEAQRRQLEVLTQELAAERSKSASLQQQLDTLAEKSYMGPRPLVPEAVPSGPSTLPIPLLVPLHVAGPLPRSSTPPSCPARPPSVPSDDGDVADTTTTSGQEDDSDGGSSNHHPKPPPAPQQTGEKRHTPPPLDLERQASSSSLVRLNSTSSLGSMERLQRQDSRLSFSSLFSNATGTKPDATAAVTDAEPAAKRLKHSLGSLQCVPSPMSGLSHDLLEFATPRSLFAAAAAEVALISP